MFLLLKRIKCWNNLINVNSLVLKLYFIYEKLNEGKCKNWNPQNDRFIFFLFTKIICSNNYKFIVISSLKRSYKPWAAFDLFLFRFTFFRLSVPLLMIFAYSSITLGTSSCATTVANLWDDDFARIKHLYSSGCGCGGRPSRGFGRSMPSSETIKRNGIDEWINGSV